MGLGEHLKKWARSKAADSDLGEQLLRVAFPKAGEWADEQRATKNAREQAEEQQRREEIASLPLATVELAVTGHVTAQWSGRLHYGWNDISPNQPDPHDPYADKPLLWFELFSEDTARPDLGGLLLRHWSFQIAGYHGDGSYDLTAINRERDAAGAAQEYLEWAMDFANADDATFYFHPDAGQSDAVVSEGGKKLSVTIAMGGALGDLTAIATILRD